jgi:histidinol-phosphatase
MNPEWRSRYETAITAAQEAGKHALRYFDNNVAVEWKKDRSPVTVADREAETLLRTTLHTAFPGDGFLGEEHGEAPSTTGFRWVLDPIDGTKSFVRGIPLWGTLVGLEYRGEPIAGVACMPAFGGTTYHALRGAGAWRDDRRIHVSTIDSFAYATLFYSSITWFVNAGKEREFLTLAAKTARQRGYGDFYGFMLVAQGSGEMMIEHGVSPWDIAALIPIVEEAGGRMTNWSEVRDIHSRDVIASNGKLHRTVLDILNKNAG